MVAAASCSAETWPVNGSDSKTPLELKNEGNAFFQRGDYDQAIEKYSMALNKVPSAVLYGNRSQAYMKKELYGAALEDAANAITMDEGYVKGFFRRASAYMALGKYKKALRDYEAICRVHPKDINASKRRDDCRKIVKRVAFEQAISVEHNKKHITERINLDAMEVEENYSGPKLDGPITLAFMKELIEYLKGQKKLHIKYVFKMLFDVYALLKTLPNMVEIELKNDEQITLCGDVHGQFYDLCHIFEMRGLPNESNPYLFNGDFVDRGSFSVETILTLFGFKLLFPHHFFLTRGNHETEVLNRCYGFEGEVKAKYNALLSEFFSEVFCYLPLCHLINRKVFVCHGGLFSKDNVTFDDIQAIDRSIQPPDEGIMCDLLWADPSPTPGRAPSRRGVSILFGPDISKKWCEDNGILYIIRSHEVKSQGWESEHDGRVFTLFSAPNYVDNMGNLGAYAVITGKNLQPQFHTFEAVKHPNVPAMAYASNAFGL